MHKFLSCRLRAEAASVRPQVKSQVTLGNSAEVEAGAAAEEAKREQAVCFAVGATQGTPLVSPEPGAGAGAQVVVVVLVYCLDGSV